MRRWGGRRGVSGLGATGLVALAAAVGLVGVGQAAYPGRDGRIVFVSDPDVSVRPQSCGDIFSIEPSGSDRRRLTHGCPWLYSDPSYSAAGDRIVLVRGHEPFPQHLHGAGIYVMSADGSNMRRVTASSSDEDPVMSPNGRSILFDRVPNGGNRAQLFLVPSRGGRARQLTYGPGGAAEGTFSPNGREIAFVGPGSNIFAVSVGGSNRRQLTHSPSRLDRWYLDPDFSPNGRRLVVECGEGDGFGSAARICVMPADGSQLKLLSPVGSAYAVDPVFSPDGRDRLFRPARLRGAKVRQR